MELGHVFIEAEIHGTEAYVMPISEALVPNEDAPIPPMHWSMLEVVELTTTLGEIGGSILRGLSKEANVLKALSSGIFAFKDPFSVYFSGSRTTWRWLQK